MADFPHLKIEHVLAGKKRTSGFPSKRTIPETTQRNLNDRKGHAQRLQDRVDAIRKEWQATVAQRQAQGLPALPTSVPVFLSVDLSNLNIDRLENGYGIEVLSVEPDGLIIGASSEGDDFPKLKKKIELFLAEQGQSKDQAAKLWDIHTGEKWRVEHILSEDLARKWPKIADDEVLIVDVSIACSVEVSELPGRDNKNDETEEHFQERLKNWRERKEQAEARRDALMDERFEQLKAFVGDYAGTTYESYADCGDSFEARVEIRGKGLRDLVINYPYLFDVTEFDPYKIPISEGDEEDHPPVDFIAPLSDAPKVCIIDSGIAEGHRYLKDAILPERSKSYIERDPSTADVARKGGHGTRVAGAVLFGNTIPDSGSHRHHCWIASARVLDQLNGVPVMPKSLYPPVVLKRIAEDFADIKIFNLSVNANRPHVLKHMSAWSHTLDRLHFEEDRVFIVSGGNIDRYGRDPFYPGIADHIAAGRSYPHYLKEPAARLTNPAYSAFALTVGSLAIDTYADADRQSLTGRDELSSFSRSGPGIWNMIKPDVVEYSGDYIIERTTDGSPPNVANHAAVTSPTVRIPGDGSGAVGRDQVGTSFAAPKVARLAARILSEWPDASGSFIRGLIAHSARWPTIDREVAPVDRLRMIGYGLPSEERILGNTPSRITFVADGSIGPRSAHIYTVRIPDELSGPGDTYEYLLEVTLAFKARSRRTRQGTKSYLSSWVDWVSSKLTGESDETFKNRVAEYSALEESDDETGEGLKEESETIKWTIRERNDWGPVKGMKRNDSTLQKDWASLKSYELPDHLSIAVVGHKGWEKDYLLEEAPYALFVSIECLTPEIEVYNPIKLRNRIEIEV